MPMMCRKAVQSKRRNELCREVQYLCRLSGCAANAQESNVCVNCWTASQVTVTPHNLVLTLNNVSKSHPTRHTLRNTNVSCYFHSQKKHGSEKKSTIQGTAFLYNIWIPTGKEDNTESSSFFPLSTFPIKLLHFLSLTIFPSNCCLCQLELDNWGGNILSMISWISVFPIYLFALRYGFFVHSLYSTLHL